MSKCSLIYKFRVEITGIGDSSWKDIVGDQLDEGIPKTGEFTLIKVAGFEIEEGLLVGLVNRLIAVFWTAALGLPALYSNLKYFDSFSIRGLINKVAQPNI